MNTSASVAMEKLINGNELYKTAKMSNINTSLEARERSAISGQKPFAIIVCCADSRVIPEAIFSCGIGELFVVRVAGNVITPSQLGSIEYAANHLGCQLCIVLGHTDCGAISAAISNTNNPDEEYMNFIIENIRSAIGKTKNPYSASCLNAKASALVIEKELDTISRPVTKPLLVAPAVYDIVTGNVRLC